MPTDQEEMERVAAMINNIPRGVLGSYTPYEKFMKMLAADTVARRLDRSVHLWDASESLPGP